MDEFPPRHSPTHATNRARRRWDCMAATYDRGERLEQWILGDARARLCALAEGQVLDIAVGTGFNLAHYPTETTVTGVDLSPEMLTRARERASRLGRSLELHEGEGTGLPFAYASFDTVVCTLGLCEIPDQDLAIREMRRVLRPQGLLLLMDHIEYTTVAMRWVERLRARLRDTTPRRRPLDILHAQGVPIERHRRTGLGLVDLVAARPTSQPAQPNESA